MQACTALPLAGLSDRVLCLFARRRTPLTCPASLCRRPWPCRYPAAQRTWPARWARTSSSGECVEGTGSFAALAAGSWWYCQAGSWPPTHRWLDPPTPFFQPLSSQAVFSMELCQPGTSNPVPHLLSAPPTSSLLPAIPYRRYRICREHCVAPSLRVFGSLQRFCQQVNKHSGRIRRLCLRSLPALPACTDWQMF
jgi:hypothetical protein